MVQYGLLATRHMITSMSGNGNVIFFVLAFLACKSNTVRSLGFSPGILAGFAMNNIGITFRALVTSYLFNFR